jgi:hypothetical protein
MVTQLIVGWKNVGVGVTTIMFCFSENDMM